MCVCPQTSTLCLHTKKRNKEAEKSSAPTWQSAIADTRLHTHTHTNTHTHAPTHTRQLMNQSSDHSEEELRDSLSVFRAFHFGTVYSIL